jgi:hypothetical protein
MRTNSHLCLVEPAALAPRGLGSVLWESCFHGLCLVIRKTAEFYGAADGTTSRETPVWLLGAGQIAPVVAGRSPLND